MTNETQIETENVASGLLGQVGDMVGNAVDAGKDFAADVLGRDDASETDDDMEDIDEDADEAIDDDEDDDVAEIDTDDVEDAIKPDAQA